MDETDMASDGTAQVSQETATVTGSDATLAAPGVPEQREGSDIADHFATPSWLGPGSTIGHVPAPHASQSPPIPEQKQHSSAPIAAEKSVLEEARWVEHTRPRWVADVVLAAAVIGVIACLVAAIVTQSLIAIVGLFCCAVVAVLFRTALVSSAVTKVELKGPRLTVTRAGVREEFNLLDPQHPVDLIGNPGDAHWALRLEAIDGRKVELTPAHVDAAALHSTVMHYRSIADRERLDRERRFNR